MECVYILGKEKIMSNKTSNVTAIISYITWVGWIIAMVTRDKSDSFTTQHINQALVINIASVIAGAVNVIPILGVVVSLALSVASFVLWVMGIYRAATWNDKPLPYIGDIRLI